MSSPNARVIRNGIQVEIPATEVVVGDILLIEAGNVAAADGRLLEAASLQVNESALTGESLNVVKSTDAIASEELALGVFLWGRIPESYNDVEDLTEKVLHEARVFITPGFIFGSNGKRYIRISLCAKENKLAEALERIKNIM